MLKATLYTLFTGLFGILLLLGFFSLFTAPEGLPMLVPLFVGFNGLVGGWNLAQRLPDGVIRGIPLLLSVLFAHGGTAFLRLFCPWVFDAFWLKPLLGTALVSLVCAWAGMHLGMWISRRSRELRESAP